MLQPIHFPIHDTIKKFAEAYPALKFKCIILKG